MTNITRNIGKFCWIAGLSLCLVGAAVGADTQTFAPANGVQTLQNTVGVTKFDLPVGVWSVRDGVAKRTLSGVLDISSYRIDATSMTAEQIMAPLRDGMAAAGYEIVLDCAAQECGGFDFYIDTPTLDPPAMFFDMRKFVAVSAIHDTGAAIYGVASRVGPVGYVQIHRLAPPDGANPVIAPVTAAPKGVPAYTSQTPPVAGGDFITPLRQAGSVILTDLEFQSGSSNLGQGPFASLDQIATFLGDTPQARVLLVGHSDAIGSLEANMSLSKKRAEAVRRYVTQTLGVAADQVQAHGIGYLSPVATNDTPSGREENRRVVAVLIMPVP